MRTQMLLTVDVILVADGKVLLIERAKDPYRDKLALPGGHVEGDERLTTAAVRELGEEVGVRVNEEDLHLLTILDTPDRDPRPGRRVSSVYWSEVTSAVLASARAASDARAVHVVPMAMLIKEQMAFDHFTAIETLKERLSCV